MATRACFAFVNVLVATVTGPSRCTDAQKLPHSHVGICARLSTGKSCGIYASHDVISRLVRRRAFVDVIATVITLPPYRTSAIVGIDRDVVNQRARFVTRTTLARGRLAFVLVKLAVVTFKTSRARTVIAGGSAHPVVGIAAVSTVQAWV